MSTALDHCWELLQQAALKPDLNDYPSHLALVPVDFDGLATRVLELLDEGATVLVMFEDASQCRFTPEPALRVWRSVNRRRGRIRLGIERRPAHGPSASWRATLSRASFENELTHVLGARGAS